MEATRWRWEMSSPRPEQLNHFSNRIPFDTGLTVEKPSITYARETGPLARPLAPN